MIYKIYGAISFVLIQIVSILLIQEINTLLNTITLYLCLTVINICVLYLIKLYKKETLEETND